MQLDKVAHSNFAAAREERALGVIPHEAPHEDAHDAAYAGSAAAHAHARRHRSAYASTPSDGMKMPAGSLIPNVTIVRKPLTTSASAIA
jgi:hypothetical protein